MSVSPRRRRAEPEHIEQRHLFEHIRRHEDRYPVLLEVYAVPNGRHRSKAEAGKLWAEGVRPGRLDINCDVPRGPWHGLRMEMKRPGRTVPDPEQVRVMLRHHANGYRADLFDDWRTAWNELVAYLGLPDRLRQQVWRRPVLPTKRPRRR